MKKSIISMLLICCVLLSGCSHICPAGEQLPFNVDQSLLTPPEKMQSIDISPLASDPK